ncbi:hypothetical protein LCGC14_0310510 [marine sediment metagenome]|uniref:Uncharacterized protein n=1 Tax=marine sediment metagenome TaxID=412755 RepID=A0A0F9WTR5_9ZZZZ
MPTKPQRPRLSRQQQLVRKSGPSEERGLLYPIHEGKQTAFMQADAEEVLYGGAAGGGKSYALRAWFVTYCMTYPGAQVVLFRQSYRQLEDTHIIALQQEIPSSIATYSSGSHVMHFDNGSMFFLRFCERDEEARTYDTSEFDAMGFDELTHFSEYTYTYLRSRCRSTKPWWPGRRIRSAATPLGIGHSWVKEYFVDQYPPMTVWRTPRQSGSYTRVFIPASVEDNYTLMKSDPTYRDTLRGLPYEEQQAKLYGNWNIFTGQFFQRWRSEIHIVEPFDIPPDWDRWIGHDYGFNAPHATLWAARPPGTQSVWFYREQYGEGVTAQEQIFKAWQVTTDSSEKLKGVVLDPSLFSKVNVKGERIKSMAEDWDDTFGKTTTVYRGNNERIPGWKLIRELLDWKEAPDGGVLTPPRMYIMKSCPNLARTLPLMISDKHNIEDIDTKLEDHAPDAARYLVRHIFQGSGQVGDAPKYYIGPKGLSVGRPKVYTPEETLLTLEGLIASHGR